MKRATAPLLLFAVVLPACFTPDVDAVRDRWKECGVVPEEAIEACSADQGSEACNDGYDSAILQSVDSIEEEQCILAVSCDDSDDKTNELTACLNA